MAKLIKTIHSKYDPNTKVRIIFNAEYEEYTAVPVINGLVKNSASYHTTDLDDAEATAKTMLKDIESKEKTSDPETAVKVNVKAKPGVKVIVITDPHNPVKAHVYKLYKCRHIYYNQAINGKLFYRNFVSCTKGHGYKHLLDQSKEYKAYRNFVETPADPKAELKKAYKLLAGALTPENDPEAKHSRALQDIASELNLLTITTPEPRNCKACEYYHERVDQKHGCIRHTFIIPEDTVKVGCDSFLKTMKCLSCVHLCQDDFCDFYVKKLDYNEKLYGCDMYRETSNNTSETSDIIE